MNIKQSKIVRAYKALEKTSGQKLPLKISHKLWSLAKLLEPHVNYQKEKEQEVLDKYGKFMNADGSFNFKDEETMRAFAEEMNDTIDRAGEEDVELIDYEKVVLKTDSGLELSIEDIDALSDFVEFEE